MDWKSKTWGVVGVFMDDINAHLVRSFYDLFLEKVIEAKAGLPFNNVELIMFKQHLH